MRANVTESKRGTGPVSPPAAAAAMNDWMDWYRQRIDAWDDRHDAIYSVGLIAAGDELVILDDPVNRAQMQTLPDYWRQ